MRTMSLKNFRYSFLNLVLTVLSFSRAFIGYEDRFILTAIFLFIVNVSCFGNEYLLNRYLTDNSSQFRKGYATFIMIQVALTLLILVVFHSLFYFKRL